MRKIRIIPILILMLIACQNLFAQSFLKSYTDPSNPNASVSFECITEKTDSSGNLYIGGHIGDTITLFKMSTSGIILSTFKIKLSPINTRLDAIMLVKNTADNTDRVVVLGNIQNPSGNQGFMFRFNPTGVVDWFRQTNTADRIVYWDMADKSGSSYIVSGEKGTNGSALILKISKATGAPSVAINYKVAGLEDPSAIQLSGSKLYATGRYALPGGTSSGDGFRFCFSRFNTNTSPHYTHLGTYHYTAPLPPLGTARTYSYDILIDGNAAVMVGSGDDNSTADPYKNLNITKVNAANGVPFWSKKYDDLSTTSDGTLTEIRLDSAKNYSVMGFAINPITGTLDKAKLWSVNPANGNLIWNRQYDLYRRTANAASTYGYGFTIVGSYIYAVGQNSTFGITKGILLKVNTTNGNVSSNDGTQCYDTLKIKKSSYTFYDSIPVDTLITTISSTKPKKQVVKIKMNDSLVCGTTSNCNCQFGLGIDGGGVINVHPNCGDTVKGMTCNASYYFIPNLTCDSSSSNTNTISVSLTDAQNNPVNWAGSFNGSGNLTIPSGISGVYTLTYYWGSNGAICDSCKYYLNITCCSTCTLTTDIRPYPSKIPIIYKCKDTAAFVCDKSYSFGPSLNCNGNSNSQIINAGIKDPFGATPAWAASFITNSGSGVLAIPAGVTSGIYTLTYTWGINGMPCDSCKIYLKITCCSNFTASAGTDIAIAGCCLAQFNATATGGTGPYSYSWSPAAGLSNSNIYNPLCTVAGTYTVTVTDASGCVYTDQAVATIANYSCCRNSSTTNDSNITISIAPNPTTSSFKINGLGKQTVSMYILNFQGIVVAQFKKVSDGDSFGESLAKGFYMLRFQFKDGTTQSLSLIKN